MRKVLFLLCFSLAFAPGKSFVLAGNDGLSNPTHMAETRGPERGSLLIIGGAASDMFYEIFMVRAGGADAPIVVIPTALTSDELTAEDLAAFKKSFTDKGFNNVTVLHTRDRNEANSSDFYRPLKKAAGVWFSGGRQWRHE